MTTFDEREKAFEKKFVLDEELKFRMTVRRNRLLGLWAAKKLGLDGPDADAYANSVIKADFETPREGNVLRKLQADFAAKKVEQTDGQIQRMMTELMTEATRQLDDEVRKDSS